MLTWFMSGALVVVNELKLRWERMHGLDFTSITHPEEVGFDPKIVYRSMPSGGWDLYRVLKLLDISDCDRIIDIGCGKGSAMRTMRRFPFGAVHGVEISAVIAAIALRNFEHIEPEDSRIHVFVEDAALFPNYADYNIFYFFNPFPAAVMQRVLQHLAEATAKRLDRSLIIYNNPKCHTLVVAAGFVLKHSTRTLDGININVYVSPLRENT